LLGVLVALAVVALCYVATHVFAGRAAFVLVGATLATIMSANVFFVIIPGQKRLVAALQKGEAPNPLDGARGKQRSVHNTYFTLPVVFAMLSVHFGAAFAHEWNWLILAGFMAAGALIRQFFVLWHSGERAWWLLGVGAALLLALGVALAPKPNPVAADLSPGSNATTPDAPVATTLPTQPDTAFVLGLMRTHCSACHSATPTLLPAAPKGTMFDTAQQVEQHAALITQQVAVLKIMPPGNMTKMSEDERAAVARWYQAARSTSAEDEE
jgi:uncharacterized membrane protein